MADHNHESRSSLHFRRLGLENAGRSNVMSKLDRITFVPDLMGGRATIRGMRFTVQNVINYLHGYTAEGLVAEFPFLEREDIEQALEYAGKPRHRRRLRKAQQVHYVFDQTNGIYTLQYAQPPDSHLKAE